MSLHDKFWPKRLPRQITPPATPLWDNVAVNARRFPDKPALVFLGRSTSYRELLAQVEQLAAKLHAAVAEAVAEGKPKAAATASDRLIDYIEDFARKTLDT